MDGRDDEHRPDTFGSTCESMMASGRRPMTRAACTYSSPLDHGRAAHRCARTAPTAKPMESTRTGIDLVVALAAERDARHAVDQQRDQDRREGKLHVGDAHDERVEPPADVAGESPRATPSTIANATEARPMPSEMRAPCMMVDRMSRPWLSLPRRKAGSPPSIQAGGLNAAFRSSAAASNGFCGEIQENAAAPTQPASARPRR